MTLPRLRAPAESGSVLSYPRLEAVGGQVDSNRSLFAGAAVKVGGVPLSQLRREAVREIIEEARAYHRAAGEPAFNVAADSLIVAGHQPELFHPGVWLKNFALNRLAARHGATALNLVVDNDTAKVSTVRVPAAGPDPAAIHTVNIAFDHFAGEIPYEERTVYDEALFSGFPGAVGERSTSWGFTPILRDYWVDVLRQNARTKNLGERFAAARRCWERRWNCHNLELPISRLCRTPAFARFAIALIEALPTFHTAYNDCVHDYRRTHGIRSLNHPVPDLSRDGEWLEAPFWAWDAGSERRTRLFVRRVGAGWQLRAGDVRWPELLCGGGVECWQRLEALGHKVRTRALTTTLFARLCLADLFIHGIGGGKYDELTDAIISRHFGIRPPAFLVLTGTLHLPFAGFPATPADERSAWRLVRDIHWNPQRHLPADAEDWQDMVEARQRVTVQSDTTWRKERFKELRRLTARIRSRVAGLEDVARSAAERVSAEAAANAVLNRRDYAFCLFPEAELRPFLTRFQEPESSEPNA